MSADQLLRRWQTEPGPLWIACNERIEDCVLELGRDAGPVVFDFDTGNNAMPDLADREVGYSATAQRDRPLAAERRGSVSHDVQEGLDHLIAIKIDKRKAGIVFALDVQRFVVLSLDDAHSRSS